MEPLLAIIMREAVFRNVLAVVVANMIVVFDTCLVYKLQS